MFRLLPRMTSDVPREFVEFVAGHLEALRRDTKLLVARDRDADSLCTDVLTDVASRWRWLELLGRRLGRPRARDSYLRVALTRRAQQWTPEDDPVEVYVWQPDAPTRRRPARSSAAVRIAPHLTPQPRTEAVPALEAAIAWLHAVKAHQRRRLVLVGIAALLLIVLVARTREELAMAAPMLL